MSTQLLHTKKRKMEGLLNSRFKVKAIKDMKMYVFSNCQLEGLYIVGMRTRGVFLPTASPSTAVISISEGFIP